MPPNLPPITLIELLNILWRDRDAIRQRDEGADEISEQADAEYGDHPLVDVLQAVARATGIDFDTLNEVARRVGTNNGLREHTLGRRGDRPGAHHPDLSAEAERLATLDASAWTAALLRELLAPAADDAQAETRQRIAATLRGRAGDWTGAADTAELAERWNRLSDRQRGCLVTLYQMGATDADRRKTAQLIAERSEGAGVDPANFKHPLADLVTDELLESRRGGASGYYLTATGVQLVERCGGAARKS